MKTGTRIFFSLCIFLSVFLCSCNKDTNSYEESTWTERWVIASETVRHPYGPAHQLCYWIKRDDNPVWTLENANLIGFEHESGYEYLVDVKVKKIKDPLEDAPDRTYTLIRIISKEKKDSDIPHFTDDLSKCTQNKDECVTCYRGIIWQGDILLTDEQLVEMGTKSGCISYRVKYWPNNVVYYTFANDFTYQSHVRQAIEEWENKTSLTFINGTGHGNYIEFFRERYC